MQWPEQNANRSFLAAESYTPPLLANTLRQFEAAQSSKDVWETIARLGRSVNLPYIDFISASSLPGRRQTAFVRTTYDSRWLNALNQDPNQARWSYFRSHAMDKLTPILVGIEFVEEYLSLPETRIDVLREAAKRGLRSGFSVPLRNLAPPQSAVMSFCGPHDKATMLKIVQEHGWLLNVSALVGHQQYMAHYGREFLERHDISFKQRELLEMLGLGLQDKQIAGELGVSVSALRQRMRHLMDKTGSISRGELAAKAMAIGMVPDPLFSQDHAEDGGSVFADGFGETALHSPSHDERD